MINTDAIDDIRHELDRLESYVEKVEDERDELLDRVEKADRAAGASRKLADAVRIMLSWQDSPPRGMDAATYDHIAANFRSDVEIALREIEG